MRNNPYGPRASAVRLISVITDGWRGEVVTALIPRDPSSPLRSALLNERSERLTELRTLEFRVYDSVHIEESEPADAYRIVDRFTCTREALPAQ